MELLKTIVICVIIQATVGIPAPGLQTTDESCLGDNERQLPLGDSLLEDSLEDISEPDFPRQFCSTPKKTPTCAKGPIKLGLSLLEDENVLGLSLLEDENVFKSKLGTSLSIDEHGFDDECDMIVEKSVDYKISDLGTSLIDTEPDVFDPDFICNVQATPKAVPAFISPEIDGSAKKSRLSTKALDIDDIKTVKKSGCSVRCKRKCLNGLTIKTIYQMRMRYWTKSMHMRTQFLLQTLDCSVNGFLMFDNGQRVCRPAFEKVLRISKNKLTVLKRKQKSHGAVTSCGRRPKTNSRPVLEAINWIENYASIHGDRMPDSNRVMLPYRTEKFSLFKRYREETAGSVSRATFYRVWKDHFTHLKVKALNSFSKCTACAFIEKQLEKTQLPHKRRRLRQLRIEHNQRQMFERKYYYSKRSKSKENPSEYLSIIVDGMDQSKSNLPHFTGRRAKIVNPIDMLKTHITGVIDHGHNHFQTYVDVGQYPHDPNLTINIILRALQKAAEMGDNKLPPTLFIQADNCWRENKNKYVLSFCELLVRENIFNEVHLSFLMVGHTHEDVDAHFSHIAAALRKTDVETKEDLLKLLPNSQEVTHMFNVKSWMENYINPLKKHTQPLHFKVAKIDEGVKISYKGKVNQRWKVLKESFFKKQRDTVIIPKGQPGFVKEDYSKLDFERLGNLIKNVAALFKKDGSVEWWFRYIDTLKKGHNRRNRAEWILDKLPRQTTTSDTQADNDIPQQIRTLISAETQEPEVIIRPTQLQTARSSTKNSNTNTNNRKRKQQQRPNTKGRRHIQKEKQRAILIYCLTEEELKKHIWTLIIWTLLQNLTDLILWLWLCRMICGELYVSLLAGDLIHFIQVTFYLWMQIIWIHIGAFQASVNRELFHVIPVTV